jgi:cold shock CspA family protein
MAITKGKVQKTVIKKTNKSATKKNDKVGCVAEDFEVDSDARYAGKVDYFDRKGGYGFIAADEEDIIPGNRVMVHWREIKSEDRWPYLYKGLEVEFGLKKLKSKDRKSWELKATEVTQIGGEPFNLCEESDKNREFCGDKNTRYTGAVKFFDNVRGFGYMTLEDGYDIPSDIPSDLRISREELNIEEKSVPRLRAGMECEFGIVKSVKGTWSAYNITLPGGEPLNDKVVQQREESSKKLSGKIAFWKADDNFGYIIPDNLNQLTKDQRAKLKESTEKHTKKNEKQGKEACQEMLYFHKKDRANSGRMHRNDEVTFKVYTDYRGIGCYEVTQVKQN